MLLVVSALRHFQQKLLCIYCR